MQAWADAYEKRLIAEHGGMLRDMTVPLWQTLNLTEGGSGIARWAGIDVFRTKGFHVFKMEMELYVRENGSSLVPFRYVNRGGYALGARLVHFSKGQLRVGLPERAAIESWAESLPEWKWTLKGDRDAITAAIVLAMNRPEVKSKMIANGKAQWENAPVETTKEWAERSSIGIHNMSDAAKQKKALNTSIGFATKRKARFGQMSPNERKKAEKMQASDAAGVAKKKAELDLLRTIMPRAKRCDVVRAKKEGWMPKPSN